MRRTSSHLFTPSRRFASSNPPTGILSAMRIRVLFFGVLRETVSPQEPEQHLDLAPSATVAAVLAHYRTLAPSIAALWDTVAVAVNQQYASLSTPLAEDDEVALLPPVSGGLSGLSLSPESLLPSDPLRPSAPDLKPNSASNPASNSPRNLFPDSTSNLTLDTSSNPPTPNPASELAPSPQSHPPHPSAWLTRDPIPTQALLDQIKADPDGAVVLFDGIVRNNTRGRPTLFLDYHGYEQMALARMRALAAESLTRFPVREVLLVHRLGKLHIGESSVLIAVASAHRGPAFDACRWLIDTLKTTVPIWKKEHFVDGAVWAQGEPFPPSIVPTVVPEIVSEIVPEIVPDIVAAQPPENEA